VLTTLDQHSKGEMTDIVEKMRKQVLEASWWKVQRPFVLNRERSMHSDCKISRLTVGGAFRLSLVEKIQYYCTDLSGSKKKIILFDI
jgi:hypothetical protein